MKTIRTSVLAAAVLLVLAGCGGDNAIDDDDASLLFADYADAQGGGFRSIDIDLTSPSVGPACGFTDAPTLQEVRDAVKDQGGRVTVSNADEFCSESPDTSTCLLRAGGSLVVDNLTEGSPDTSEIEIIIPGLGNGKRAYFYLAATGSTGIATASIETPSNSIPSSGNCEQTTTIQAPETINGAWFGYKVAYNASTLRGTETSVKMTCAAQACTISGAPFGALQFSDFKTTGAWRATLSGYTAGAAVSPDDNALAVYVCTTPLVNSTALTQCSLYGFSRDE